MQVIYKYPIQVFGFEYGEVELPEGTVLKVDIKHGICTVWVLQKKDEVALMRLVIVPTGEEFDDSDLVFIGSAISPTFCWHVFRRY